MAPATAAATLQSVRLPLRALGARGVVPHRPPKQQKQVHVAPEKDAAAHRSPPLRGSVTSMLAAHRAHLAATEVVYVAFERLVTDLVHAYDGPEFELQRGVATRLGARLCESLAEDLSSSTFAASAPPALANGAATQVATRPPPQRPAWQAPSPPQDTRPVAAGKETTEGAWSTVTAPRTGPRGPKKNKIDLRVLLRVSSPSSRHAEPYALKRAITEKLGLEEGAVRSVDRIPTGWAVSAKDIEVRQALLAPDKSQALKELCKADSVTVAQKWYTYAVPGLPTQISSPWHDAPLRVADHIMEEITQQAGMPPVDYRPSKHGPNVYTGLTTWLVSFLEPAPIFKLFGTSEKSRLVTKTERLTFHQDGCLGYCQRRRCLRPKRCPRCSDLLSKHAEGDCTRDPRCWGCKGPFVSGHEKCPAAPIMSNGVLKFLPAKDLREVRRHGARNFAKATATGVDMGPSSAAAASAPAAGADTRDVPGAAIRAKEPGALKRTRGGQQSLDAFLSRKGVGASAANPYAVLSEEDDDEEMYDDEGMDAEVEAFQEAALAAMRERMEQVMGRSKAS